MVREEIRGVRPVSRGRRFIPDPDPAASEGVSRGLPFMMSASALEGGGVHGKADKGNRGCVNVTVTRGRGSKNPKILQTSYMEAP